MLTVYHVHDCLQIAILLTAKSRAGPDVNQSHVMLRSRDRVMCQSKVLL